MERLQRLFGQWAVLYVSQILWEAFCLMIRVRHSLLRKTIFLVLKILLQQPFPCCRKGRKTNFQWQSRTKSFGSTQIARNYQKNEWAEYLKLKNVCLRVVKIASILLSKQFCNDVFLKSHFFKFSFFWGFLDNLLMTR